LYCSKERRCTDHLILHKEAGIGKYGQVVIKCLTCKNPDERIDIIVEDRISVKKTVWDEFKKTGYDDIHDSELVVEDPGEERRQHQEQVKKFKDVCRKILNRWKAILIISVASLFVLKFIFQVI
jgi:hypothetical protein